MKLILVDCGNCRYVFAHRKPTPDELTCPNCGWSGEPCDFPDTNAWQQGRHDKEQYPSRACLSSLVIMGEEE